MQRVARVCQRQLSYLLAMDWINGRSLLSMENYTKFEANVICGS